MIISILNHKGGTGKTTSTINLGKALALQQKKVLLIDLDSQANLSYSLGIPTDQNTLGEILFKNQKLNKSIIKREGMDIVPGSNNLYQYEETIIRNNYGYFLLKEVLQNESYDYILIDCPPSQSQLNINALCASQKVLVPMRMDVLSLVGLNQILNTVQVVKENLNKDLEVLGVLGVLVDGRRQLTKEITEHVQSNYPVTVFTNYIRANVKAAEAPSHGISLIEYSPNSTSAVDYISAANELMELVKTSIKN